MKSQRPSIASTACALLVCAVFCALALPLGSGAAERLHLRPKFVVGQSLRYQITTRTTTTSTTTTPIVNTEGASQLKQTLLMQLRIDVLAVNPGATSTIRLRATYEKASATSESDTFDPSAATLVDQFDKLEGRAVEFTIDADGKLSHVAGLDQLLADPVAANTVRSSMAGLSASALFPKEGIVIGQKWTNEQPLENAPLAGLTWRTESTYMRDESVPALTAADPATAATPASASSSSAATTSAASAADTPCATIVTKFQIFRHGSEHGDATPPDYVHNGLRTSGTWTGSGESLDSISLATGLLVRSTQTTTQSMDFEILSPTTGSKIHYVGQVETQSHVILLP